MGALPCTARPIPASPAAGRAQHLHPDSKPLTRRAGCGHSARPDLWGPSGRNPLGLPEHHKPARGSVLICRIDEDFVLSGACSHFACVHHENQVFASDHEPPGRACHGRMVRRRFACLASFPRRAQHGCQGQQRLAGRARLSVLGRFAHLQQLVGLRGRDMLREHRLPRRSVLRPKHEHL